MEHLTLLKGKAIADRNRQECLDMIAEMTELRSSEKGASTGECQSSIGVPQMVVFLIGNDPASEYYVQSMQKQSGKYGVRVTLLRFAEISQDDLIKEILALNDDDSVNGIMVQKPLPKNIDPAIIELTISPEKDIDGFHPLNTGLMVQEKECFLPCTAQAILEIIDYYNICVEGKHTVIVGRSNVVGKPVANLLLYKAKNRNATITVCHSRTPDLGSFTRMADILITAVGVAELIKGDMIKEGVVIIDAGINEIPADTGQSSTKIVGDVDFEQCAVKSSAITPVPGGVGSVTTSILFKHLCLSAKKSFKK